MKYTISGMKITRVSVKNFKNFLDTTISNIDDVALFVGKNGVGKSNFLSIFDFIKRRRLKTPKSFSLGDEKRRW